MLSVFCVPAKAQLLSFPGLNRTWTHCFIYNASEADCLLVGLKPESKGADMFGDRDCSHLNITGSNVLASSPNIRKSARDPRKSEIQISPTTWQDFNELTPWGQSGFRNPDSYDLLYHQWEFVGDTVFELSYTRDVTPDPRYGYSVTWTKAVCSVTGTSVKSVRHTATCSMGSDLGPYSPQHPGVAWSSVTSTTYSSAVLDGSSVPAVFAKQDYLHAISVGVPALLEYIRIPVPYDIHGTLSQRAAEQAKAIKTNLWTLVPEILRLKRSIRSLWNQLTDPLLLQSVRKLADLELSLKYGVRLTWIDTQKQAKRLMRRITEYLGYARAKSQVITSGFFSLGGIQHSYTQRWTMKVWYDPTPRNILQNIAWTLQSYCVLPSMENVWDLIPYTFVVDWFVGFNDWFSQMDAKSLIGALDVKSVLVGSKTEFSVSADDIPYLSGMIQGWVDIAVYSRYHCAGLTPPVPTLSGSQEFHNYVEFGAILTQLAVK